MRFSGCRLAKGSSAQQFRKIKEQGWRAGFVIEREFRAFFQTLLVLGNIFRNLEATVCVLTPEHSFHYRDGSHPRVSRFCNKNSKSDFSSRFMNGDK